MPVDSGPGANRRAIALALALALGTLGVVACEDPPEPCGAGRNLDVHFAYATGDTDGEQAETRACTLAFAGETTTGAGLIVLDCPGDGADTNAAVWEVDLEGAEPLELELELGDDVPVTARSLVADPSTLACGERGWLTLADADGRAVLAVAALAAPAPVGGASETVMDLGELGPVTLIEAERDGCPGLLLQTEASDASEAGGAVWVPAAATTPIELAGVALIAELGPRGGSSCTSAGYDLLLRRRV